MESYLTGVVELKITCPLTYANQHYSFRWAECLLKVTALEFIDGMGIDFDTSSFNPSPILANVKSIQEIRPGLVGMGIVSR